MKLTIEIDKKKLQELVLDYIEKTLGDIPLNVDSLKIETKSSQNYKSEWENADFRAVYQSIS